MIDDPLVVSPVTTKDGFEIVKALKAVELSVSPRIPKLPLTERIVRASCCFVLVFDTNRLFLKDATSVPKGGG
jgi:hypothetical protein